MNAEVEELYQSVILDHNRKPRNFREMRDADYSAEGNNPLCGDQLTLWVRMDSDRIADVSFTGKGCAISKASASLMTSAVKGKTRGEAEEIFHDFHEMVTGKLSTDTKHPRLGHLAVLGGVARFPMRVKCASLPWHTLKSALEGRQEEVSTES